MNDGTLSVMETQLGSSADAQSCFSIWTSLKACGAQQWELDALSVSTIRLTIHPLYKLCLSAFRLIYNLHKHLTSAVVVLSEDRRSLSCQVLLRVQKYAVTDSNKPRDHKLRGHDLTLASKFPEWCDRSDKRLLKQLLNGLCRLQEHVPVLSAKAEKSEDNARITLTLTGYGEVDLCVLRQLLETQFGNKVQNTEVLCIDNQIAVQVTVVRTNVAKRKRDDN